jgi:hypothetical protein
MGVMSRLDAPRVAVVGAALADGMSATLQHDTTLLVDGDRVAGLWVDGTGPDPGGLGAAGTTVIDASGATLVPGMVDSHAHLSMPGGAQWVQRGFDPEAELLDVGEDNGAAMVRAGIRWARDVGAPRGSDGRALSLVLRDRWSGAHERPYVRAAGTWLTRSGSLPPGLAVELEHGADLRAAVAAELDAGADRSSCTWMGRTPTRRRSASTRSVPLSPWRTSVVRRWPRIPACSPARASAPRPVSTASNTASRWMPIPQRCSPRTT